MRTPSRTARILPVLILSAGLAVITAPQAAAQGSWVDTLAAHADAGCKKIPAVFSGTTTGAVHALVGGPGKSPGLGFRLVGGASTTATVEGGAVAGAGSGVTGTTASLSAGHVAAGAATFVGAFCTTGAIMDWLDVGFFESSDRDELSTVTIPDEWEGDFFDPRNCSEFGVTPSPSSNKCVAWPNIVAQAPYNELNWTKWAHWPTDQVQAIADGTNNLPFLLIGRPTSRRPTAYKMSPATVHSQGLSSAWNAATFTTAQVVQVACNSSYGQACGWSPSSMLQYFGRPGTSGAATAYLAIPPSLDIMRNGLFHFMKYTLTCWDSSAFSSYTTYIDDSATFRDTDTQPGDWDPGPCPAGKAPRDYKYERYTIGRNPTTIQTWRSPMYDNPASFPEVTRACWIVGNDCDLTPALGDPEGTVRIGGPTGYPIAPEFDPEVDTAPGRVVDVARAVDEAEPAPTTTAAPATTESPSTSSAPATSVGVTTAAPPTDVPPATTPDGPTPPPATDPPGSSRSWDGCIADQSPSWDEVTWNPLTWVRAILQWVWAPIFCALWWAFVPPGGAQSLADPFVEMWDDAELLAPVRAFAANVEPSRNCTPFPWTEGVTIDLAQCENDTVQAVWSVVLFLGLVGVCFSIFRNAANLRSAGGPV